MRICLISREYPPDTGWGGIATFANHLALGLVAIGHEVEVVALAASAAKSELRDGVKVHRVRPYEFEGELGASSLCMPYSRYVMCTASALWQKFQEIHSIRPFDVVDTPELLAEGIYPAMTRLAPLIIRLYTPHSKFIAEQLHNVTASFDHQFVALMERIAMLSADAITSPSADLAQYVARDLNISARSIKIIPNPIDPACFSPDGPKALASDGRAIVLFVGRLEERKGISYLIEAIPQVVKSNPDVRFVIVGDDTNNGRGQKSVLAELKQSIAAHGCGRFIEFIPRVPLAELACYYRSADICVVPSVYDNSPYTCLEAMSCGRPVIGTSGGGTREYIVDGESGIIVPSRDSNSIASALNRLLEDKTERCRLGSNARARVIERFDRVKIARQTVELYEQAGLAFRLRRQPGIYRKQPQQMLGDAEAVLYSYDKMLYDLLYRQSFRFRLRHWWILCSTRPRLTAAKVFMALITLVVPAVIRNQERCPEIIQRLEEAIKEKQRRKVASE